MTGALTEPDTVLAGLIIAGSLILAAVLAGVIVLAVLAVDRWRARTAAVTDDGVPKRCHGCGRRLPAKTGEWWLSPAGVHCSQACADRGRHA